MKSQNKQTRKAKLKDLPAGKKAKAIKGGDESPKESVSLGFGTIKWTYKGQ